MAEFDFRPPQLSDREWAVKLLAESDFRGCLYTFGNNYVWRNAYNAEICRIEDFYLLKNHRPHQRHAALPISVWKWRYPEIDSRIKKLLQGAEHSAPHDRKR